MPDERFCLALILGASAFPALGLPENEAFANSARALEDYLVAQSSGPAEYHVETLFDSDLTVIDQSRRIDEALRAHPHATDLLVYYVGHGSFIRGADYFLALRTTQRDLEDVTGLRSSTLAAIVSRTFANRRVFVLLDCCFAGQVLHEFQTHDVGRIVEGRTFSQFPRRGTALLVASSKDEPAVSPARLRRTMFCEGLMTVLSEGIKDGGPHLSLAAVGDRLREVLQARFGADAVLPEIHSPRQTDGDIARTPLFSNPAHALPELDETIVIALRNELPRVRVGAVETLKTHLGSPIDDDERALIVATLARLSARDDSNLVRARAAEGLPGASPPPPPAATIEPIERDDMASETDGEVARTDAAAETALAMAVIPDRRRIAAGETVAWTCSVTNAGSTAVQAIEVTDSDGTQLRPPFDLAVGDCAELRVDKRYGARGARERFAALGRAPDGRLVSAEARGRVRVRQPAPVRSETPVPVHMGETRPALPMPEAPVTTPAGAASPARASFSVPRFRAAFREVKATTELGDAALNELIALVDEGERHFRIASNRSAAPADWLVRVAGWQRAVAAERGDAIVMLPLDPPTPAAIVDDLRRLVGRIEERTGVHISVDEFPTRQEDG